MATRQRTIKIGRFDYLETDYLITDITVGAYTLWRRRHGTSTMVALPRWGKKAQNYFLWKFPEWKGVMFDVELAVVVGDGIVRN